MISIELHRKLGSGTFGSVFSADITCPLVTGKVALKRVFTPTLLPESRELRALCLEKNNHLMHVLFAFASQDANGHQFHNFVLPFMSRTLGQVIREFPRVYAIPWPPEPLAHVLRGYYDGLLSGLNLLHQARWIHRDITGNNIMLDETGTIKLCDLGCSCQVADAPHSTVVGCPSYRSPEQFFGHRYYTEKIDMWSFAVLMSEFGRCGTHLFPNTTETEEGPMMEALALLGPPPPGFLDRNGGQTTRDIVGARLDSMPRKRITRSRLRGHVANLSPFHTFLIEKFLRWEPDERPSAIMALKELSY